MPDTAVIPLQDFRAQYDSVRADIAIALAGVLERQDFILGREVTELEEAMARLSGARFAIACASGSDALLLSLMALDIKAGDEVVVPAFTFFATASAVTRLGGLPVFADIDAPSFNITAATAERALLAHPRARAVISVDLFGQVPEMDEIRARLSEPVAIVEDAAQAVLAEYGGRRAGSFGAASCFSFYPTKNLGAYGDAGLITTSNEPLADRLRLLRVHGGHHRYFHDEVGINSRLDTLQAAVLLVKLRRLEDWTRARERAAANYARLFEEKGLSCAGQAYPSPERPVTLPVPAPGARRRHVYHQYTIRALDRDALRTALDASGIRSAVFYPLPLHLQKCFAYLGGGEGDCPESERAAREVLSLPIFPEITGAQQERVVDAVARFYGR